MTVCFLLPTVSYVDMCKQHNSVTCVHEQQTIYICVCISLQHLLSWRSAILSYELVLYFGSQKKKIFQCHTGSTSSAAGQFWVFENSFLNISTPVISWFVQSRGIKDESVFLHYSQFLAHFKHPNAKAVMQTDTLLIWTVSVSSHHQPSWVWIKHCGWQTDNLLWTLLDNTNR